MHSYRPSFSLMPAAVLSLGEGGCADRAEEKRRKEVGGRVSETMCCIALHCVVVLVHHSFTNIYVCTVASNAVSPSMTGPPSLLALYVSGCGCEYLCI
jgi:hypothetical protein